MTSWFTADHHFWHENIIEYEKRPWKNAAKMNHELVKLHNSVVSSSDTVYFVGDLTIKGPDYKRAIEKLIRKMHGRKVMVLGNHDQLNPFDYIDIGFESVHTSLRILLPHGGAHDHVCLVHDPAVATIDRSRFFLCGHVHGLFQQVGNVINVGVDVREFKPVSLQEMWEICKILLGRNEMCRLEESTSQGFKRV